MSQIAAAKLTRTVQSWNLHPKLTVAIQDEGLEPTALLTRVLPQTATDFADVLVDGRCASGTGIPGNATAIWMHCSSNSGEGTSNTTGVAPATTDASTAPASGGPTAATVAAAEETSAAVTPLYCTTAAQQERLNLLSLHALHCVLSAAAVPVASSAPKLMEVGIILCRDAAAVDRLFDVLCDLCASCRVFPVRVSAGQRPPTASALLAGATAAKPSTPRPAAIVVATLKGFFSWDWPAFLRCLPPEAAAKTEREEKSSSEGNPAESPTSSATLTPAASTQDKELLIHVAALGVEDIGGLQSIEEEATWDGLMRELQLQAERLHVRYTSVTHQSTHHCWVCLGPPMSLSALVRSRLSRRNRRYYSPLPPHCITTSAAAASNTGPGTTAPCPGVCMRYLFYQNEEDREELLKMILKQAHIFNRVLLMTHHKDIRHMHAVIQGWGIYDTSAAAEGSSPAPAKTPGGADAASVTAKTTATETRQYFMQRNDTNEKQIALQLSFTRTPALSADTNGSSAKLNEKQSSLLIAWDAYPAVDLMDVDCVIQYYPPQKSLTEREWAEFIQVLHTTCDGEMEVESALRGNSNNTESYIETKMEQLRQNLSTNTPHHASHQRKRQQPPVIITFLNSSDFSLCSYFMQQYYHSGGVGTLSAAAAASNFTAVTACPGPPGVLLPSGNPINIPVLNISPHHPLFVPLITGMEENRARGLPSFRLAGMEDPPSLCNVLKVKLRREQDSGPKGGSSAYSILNSNITASGSGGGGCAAATGAAVPPSATNGIGKGGTGGAAAGQRKGGGTVRTNRNESNSNSKKAMSPAPVTSGVGGRERRKIPTSNVEAPKKVQQAGKGKGGAAAK